MNRSEVRQIRWAKRLLGRLMPPDEWERMCRPSDAERAWAKRIREEVEAMARGERFATVARSRPGARR